MPVKHYIEQIDRNRYYFFDDFGGANYDNRTWTYTSSGTSGIAKLNALGGQVRLTIGSTAGNVSYLSQLNNYNVSGPCDISWFTKIEDLTNVAVQLGAYIDATHDITILYNTAVGANWLCQCANGGGASTTTVDSLVAADTNWHRFRIVAKTASVEFFLDSILLATIATNIPTSNMTLWAYGYRNAGGAGTRSFLIDWVEAFGGRI